MLVSIFEVTGVSNSADARGRCFDNIYTERFWRSLKYEEVYLKNYDSVADVRNNLQNFLRFYNFERLHQSLGSLTPAEIYFSDPSQELLIPDEKKC